MVHFSEQTVSSDVLFAFLKYFCWTWICQPLLLFGRLIFVFGVIFLPHSILFGKLKNGHGQFTSIMKKKITIVPSHPDPEASPNHCQYTCLNLNCLFQTNQILKHSAKCLDNLNRLENLRWLSPLYILTYNRQFLFHACYDPNEHPLIELCRNLFSVRYCMVVCR